jgi:DNA replication protein DnaC
MARDCEICGGVGYLIGRRGELAHASLCSCQATCSECKNLRFVLGVEDGYEVARPCGCTTLLERMRLYNEAGIPGAYADRHLANFIPGANDTLAEAKARMGVFRTADDVSSQRGVLLLGGPGLGKTHLVVGLITHLTLQRAIACRFVDFYQLCARIRSTFGHESQENERSIIDPLVDVPVLVLDDLGKGQGSAWELTVVDQIVTRRYNAKRIILATTNYLPRDIVETREREQATAPPARARRGTAFDPTLEERIDARLVSRHARRASSWCCRATTTGCGSTAALLHADDRRLLEVLEQLLDLVLEVRLVLRRDRVALGVARLQRVHQAAVLAQREEELGALLALAAADLAHDRLLLEERADLQAGRDRAEVRVGAGVAVVVLDGDRLAEAVAGVAREDDGAARDGPHGRIGLGGVDDR